MKTTLTDQEISNIVDKFEELDEKVIENLSQEFAKQQPYLISFIEAAYEIFEDEEDYIEELDYNALLIDYIFTKTLGEQPTIMPDFLEKKDDEHLSIIEQLGEDEEFDDGLYGLFESHPRADLILYFYGDLFDEDIDFDDEALELTTQLMLLIYFIIDVYHQAANQTNEA